ncbi:MAG TPA: acyltransferase [Kaistia sp.]|nr:acyltransferase [Kaistia sp.]
MGRAPISPHDAVLLDCFRAIAAALVVVFHARVYTLGNNGTDGAAGLVYSVANCGTQAVFWFFVLSGYLVGGSVLVEIAKSGRMDLRRYALSRVTRLYIVLVPALLVTGVLDYWRISTFGMNNHAGFETPDSYAAATLLGNVFFLQTTVVPTFGSNLALWSLANEFWYYLLFPLLFAPLMGTIPLRRRLALFLCGIGVLTFLGFANFSIVWLFSIWCMGALARVFPVPALTSRPIALVLAVLAVGAFSFLRPYIGPLATLLVGLTFTNLLLSLRREAPATPGLLTAGARHFAAFSFSLYAVHLPLQHLLATTIQADADPYFDIDPRSIVAPLTIIALAAASIAFGYVFSRLTEAHTEFVRRFLLGGRPQGRGDDIPAERSSTLAHDATLEAPPPIAPCEASPKVI